MGPITTRTDLRARIRPARFDPAVDAGVADERAPNPMQRLVARTARRSSEPVARIRRATGAAAPTAQCVATVFPSARSDTRRTLAESAPLRAFARHDQLLSQGDAAAVVAIVSGTVTVRTSDDDGRRLTMAILGPGDLAGVMSASRFDTSLNDVVGLAAGTWVSWSGHQIRRLSQLDPGMAADLFDHAAERIARLQELLAQATFESARERFARALLDYEPLICCDAAILSRADVASLVGVTREMIGIVMRDFETIGLIRRRGATIDIVDRRRLAALVPSPDPSGLAARVGIARGTDRTASTASGGPARMAAAGNG